MSRTRQQMQRQGQRRHQRAVERQRQVAERRRQQPRRLFGRADADSLINETTMLGYMGQHEQAETLLAEVKRKYPTYPSMAAHLAYIRILAGDIRPETFRALQSRPDGLPRVEGLKAFREIPLWGGQPIEGKRLLVWGWSGFGYGDLIQNYRLVPTAKVQSGATLTLGCPKGLSRLFQGLPGVDVFIEPPLSTLEGIDYHLPAEFLPVVCPLTTEILQACPYLYAEPESIERWRPMFADKTWVHFGLHWIADKGHGNAWVRTMPLQALSPLFDVPYTKWYSLQLGAAAEVAAFPEVVDLGQVDDPLAKFVQASGIIMNLDSVVCIDSSIGHLTGALGRSCYVVLGLLCDPQWGADLSGDALWYPATRVRRPVGMSS